MDFGANLDDEGDSRPDRPPPGLPTKGNTITIPNPFASLSADANATVTLTFVRPPSPDVSAPSQVDRGLLSSLLGRSRSPSPTVERPKSEEKVEDRGEDDDYDKYVRMLAALPKNAKAGDRARTEEEKLRDRREELIKREEERRRRMTGEVRDDDDLEAEIEEDELGEDERLRRMEQRLARLEDEQGDGDNEDEDEDDDVVENLLDEEEDSVPTAKIQPLIATLSKAKNQRSGRSDALPFTFPCPSSHEQFLKILDGSDLTENSSEKLDTIIERVRTLYHPKFAEGNKKKLEAFQTVLIDHFLYMASFQGPNSSLLNIVTKHILPLAVIYPVSTSTHIISKLKIIQSNLTVSLATSPSSWAGKAELSLFRLIGLIFSTSDYHHAVVSPAMLLMAQYLGQCRITDLRHITTGLFLCSLVLQYEEEFSKRFMPEAINFLANVVGLLMVPREKGKGRKDEDALPGCLPFLDWNKDLRHKLVLGEAERQLVPSKLAFDSIWDLQGNESQVKVNLSFMVLFLSGRYAKMCASLPAFLEIFEPVKALTEMIPDAILSPTLQSAKTQLLSDLSRMINVSFKSRRPLQLQDHRPVGIPTFLPKFDDDHNLSSHSFDPNAERVAAQKLRAQYRKERKGAIRELRKDNKFLAAEEARQRKQDDERYKKKVNRIMGGLEMERKEEKDFARIKEREKKKDKKRAGGKSKKK